MLKITKFHSLEDKRAYVSSDEFHNATWIVSDLHAKFEIQKSFHNSGRKIIEEIVALRANELWTELGTRICPEYTVVSNNLIHSLISQIVSKENSSHTYSTIGCQRVAKYVEQFLPVFSSFESIQLVVDWLKANELPMIRWGQWFSLAHLVWSQLDEKKLISHNWLSGLLVNHPNLLENWSRNLVVDLGPDLTQVEAEIFLKLSEVVDVEVLFIESDWMNEYTKTFSAYEVFRSDLFKDDMTSTDSVRLERVTDIKRFSTNVAEVKDVVAQVRKWFEEGISFHDIVVVAPDIELFWPTLVTCFEEEGIPYNKDLMVNLQAFPDIGRWLGKLRLQCGKVTTSDLEIGSFGFEDSGPLKYEEFRATYARIFDQSDIARKQEVSDRLGDFEKDVEVVGRDVFLNWALGYWAGGDSDRLQQALAKIVVEVPRNIEFSLGQWVSYLEMTCTQIEFSDRSGMSGGVRGMNINSCEWVSGSHFYFLGLTEEKFSSAQKTEITLGDVLKLRNDLGINIAYPDSKALEFKLLWKLQQNFKSAVISFSGTGFDGSVQAPALLWLQEAVRRDLDPDRVSSPQVTRWDALLANIRSETDILGLHRNSSTCSELKVKKEASKQVGADFGSEVKFSLSASKLERFALCPYLVASTLLFKLDDLEELDLDLDRLTNGKLTHKYFEVLLSEPLKLERTFDEHLEIIDRCREEIELSLADERFWSPLRNRFAKLGTRFLNVEREWRRQFPETRTIGREVGIRGHWSISNRCLSPKKIDDRDIFFRGFIDRIDCDSHGNLVVIDYKSSGSSYKNYSKWIEANSFQLAMYTEALEQGLVDSIGEHGEVVGACILNVKEMTREKGFVVKDRGDRLLPPKRGMLVSKDEIGKVLSNLRGSLSNTSKYL